MCVTLILLSTTVTITHTIPTNIVSSKSFIIMTLSITKREVLSQVRYNLKVESMRRKNIGQKPMSKLDKVFYWSDFTEALYRDQIITESQIRRWSNPYEFRNY